MKKKMVAGLLIALMISSAVFSALPVMAETDSSFKEMLESNYTDPDRVYSSDAVSYTHLPSWEASLCGGQPIPLPSSGRLPRKTDIF